MEENNSQVKIIRFAALSLRKPLPEEKDYARLTWSMRGEYPRLTVYTSTQKSFTETNTLDYNFVIIAPFDIVTLMYFLETMTLVANNPKASQYTINCLNNKVENGVRTSEVIIQAAVTFGKNDQGIVYISVTEDGKRKVVFELLPNNQWFKYQDQDGNTITDKAFLSKVYTLSYIETIKRLMIPKYIQYTSEVMIDKPNIVRENKVENNKKEIKKDLPKEEPKEEKQEVSVAGPKDDEVIESTIKVDESKLQDLKKVPAEEKVVDTDFEALLSM